MFSSGEGGGYVAEKSESAGGWLFPVGDGVHELGYTDMFDSLDEGRVPRESFYDGYVVNVVMDAVYASAESRRWEPVQLDDWRGGTTERLARKGRRQARSRTSFPASIARRPPRMSADGQRRPRADAPGSFFVLEQGVPVPPSPRPRLVVAEDQALIRLDLERLFEEAGFDGQEAVELALALRPDIVVLDVKMPRLDGVEAARRILDDGFVPIVMLTAYGYGELISRAVDAGVVGFVVKPFKESALIEALHEALEHAPDPAALSYLGLRPRD
jgi:CheY-like chemotaxis protein